MAKNPRGVLLDGSTIVLLDGTKIQTFWGCDMEYLKADGIKKGDLVSFSYVSGTKHAEGIRKVAKPSEKELAFQKSVTKARA
jgi:hypothetical protein